MLNLYLKLQSGSLVHSCPEGSWRQDVRCRANRVGLQRQPASLPVVPSSLRKYTRPNVQLYARRKTTKSAGLPPQEPPADAPQTPTPKRGRPRKSTSTQTLAPTPKVEAQAEPVQAEAPPAEAQAEAQAQPVEAQAEAQAQPIEAQVPQFAAEASQSSDGVEVHDAHHEGQHKALNSSDHSGQATASSVEESKLEASEKLAIAAVEEQLSGQPAAQQSAGERQLPALNRQGYHSFEMHGVELLVAETSAGQLDLGDCFVLEAETEVYSRPSSEGSMPAGPCTFQAIPWYEEFLGDRFKEARPWRKVHKMIFIPVVRQHPYTLDLEQVFIFDGAKRLLRRALVEHAGPQGNDPVLRIRENRITIEDASWAPDLYEVVKAFEEGGREAMPQVSDELLKALQEEAGFMPQEPLQNPNDDVWPRWRQSGLIDASQFVRSHKDGPS